MRTWHTIATLTLLLMANTALAGTPATSKWRAEAGLYIQNWQGLADLTPSAGGSFNSIGYGLHGSMHWRVKQWQSSRLLLGFDGGIGATESSTEGFIGDLMARQLSLGPSLRWEFGDENPFSVNAGFAWYLIDIAESDFDWIDGGIEAEYWEETAMVPFVGISVDRKMGRFTNLTFGMKLHMADFGRVYDQDTFGFPLLGTDAGDLDGAMLQFYMGTSFR